MRAILFCYLILFCKDAIVAYASYCWNSLCNGWGSMMMRDRSFWNIQLISHAPSEEELP
jgi:hypothetical protein